MTIIDTGKQNEIYNVAGGFEQTNADTVRKIIAAFNGTDDDWKNHIDFSCHREGQDLRYALNDRKLKDLGWTPQKQFDDEIQRIVQHYKTNFTW